MRYFQISNGLHGCLWDYSTAVACNSIDDLAHALKEHYNDVASSDYDEEVAPLLKDDEARDWAEQCWRLRGSRPISYDVGRDDSNYCVACNPCTAVEAEEINDACA